MYEQADQPPLEITEFLDRLQATGQCIVPDSLIWLPHPDKPGWLVPAVKLEERADVNTIRLGED